MFKLRLSLYLSSFLIFEFLINDSSLVSLSSFFCADQSVIIIWIQLNSVINIELSEKDNVSQLGKSILELNDYLNFLIYLMKGLLFKVNSIVIFVSKQSDSLYYLSELSNSWLIALKKVNEVNKYLTQSLIAELNSILLLISLN